MSARLVSEMIHYIFIACTIIILEYKANLMLHSTEISKKVFFLLIFHCSDSLLKSHAYPPYPNIIAPRQKVKLKSEKAEDRHII